MSDPTTRDRPLTPAERREIWLNKILREKGYELTASEPLGQGGFSVVLRAQHLRDGFDVAVKIHTDPGRRLLFHGEAETLEKLRPCPGVIQILGHESAVKTWKDGTTEWLMFLVLELAETSLDKLLAERRTLDVREATPILHAVTEALEQAHERGVAHNDLKTSSVLKVGSTWKLGDFNLSRADHLAKAGTWKWVNPVKLLWATRYPIYAADIDSLGKLLHVLLTGSLPGESPDGVVPGKTLGGPIEAIYRGCVNPNPRYRYQSARRVAEDFEGWVAEKKRPSRMPRVPRLVRAWRVAKARPIRSSLITVMVAVLIGLIAQGALHRRRIAGEVGVFQTLKAEAGRALELARGPARMPDRTLDGYPASNAERSKGNQDRLRGRAQAELARDLVRRMKEVMDGLGPGGGSTTRALVEDFARMDQVCRDLLEHYEAWAQDCVALDELEEVRLNHSLSLQLVSGGIKPNAASRVKGYARVFRERLRIDLRAGPVNVEEMAARLARRPARRVYAAYLIDFVYHEGLALAEDPVLLLSFFFGTNQRIQSLRELAAKIDDTDPWASNFQQMMVSIGGRQLSRRAKALASVADPSVIPPPKLAILGEALIENDLPAAVDLLTKYQSAHPGDFWANHLLAEAFALGSDVREVEFRHNAVNLRRQSAVARFLLGMAYWRQIRKPLDEDKLRLAKPHFAVAIRMNPTLWDQLPDDLKATWPQIDSLDR